MSAQAQQASTAPATSEVSGGLEEIVVTAERREENIQNVPIAVTAFTAEATAEPQPHGHPRAGQSHAGRQPRRRRAVLGRPLGAVGLDPRHRPGRFRVQPEPRRRRLSRRRVPGAHDRREPEPARRGPHRDPEGSAGHAVRRQHHRRRDQHRHPYPGNEARFIGTATGGQYNRRDIALHRRHADHQGHAAQSRSACPRRTRPAGSRSFPIRAAPVRLRPRSSSIRRPPIRRPATRPTTTTAAPASRDPRQDAVERIRQAQLSPSRPTGRTRTRPRCPTRSSASTARTWPLDVLDAVQPVHQQQRRHDARRHRRGRASGRSCRRRGPTTSFAGLCSQPRAQVPGLSQGGAAAARRRLRRRAARTVQLRPTSRAGLRYLGSNPPRLWFDYAATNTGNIDTTYANGPDFARHDQFGGSVTGVYDLTDGLTLKSITGYRQIRWDIGTDLDGTPETLQEVTDPQHSGRCRRSSSCSARRSTTGSTMSPACTTSRKPATCTTTCRSRACCTSTTWRTTSRTRITPPSSTPTSS